GSAASTPISATRRAMPGRWSRRAHDVRAVYASPHEGGSREQADSANSPLAVRHFYGDRHRQFRHHGPGCPPGLGGLFATAAALLDAGHRSLHVCAALSAQVAPGSVSAMTRKRTTRVPTANLLNLLHLLRSASGRYCRKKNSGDL